MPNEKDPNKKPSVIWLIDERNSQLPPHTEQDRKAPRGRKITDAQLRARRENMAKARAVRWKKQAYREVLPE